MSLTARIFDCGGTVGTVCRFRVRCAVRLTLGRRPRPTCCHVRAQNAPLPVGKGEVGNGGRSRDLPNPGIAVRRVMDAPAPMRLQACYRAVPVLTTNVCAWPVLLFFQSGHDVPDVPLCQRDRLRNPVPSHPLRPG
jgi:hypothetical protein